MEKIKTTVKNVRNRVEIPNIISQMDSPVICEVGVRFGDNLDNMITNNVKSAYGVDIWRNTGETGQNDNEYSQEELDEQYKNILLKYKEDSRIKIIRDFSVEAAKSFEDGFFDFIYIDADHTYQGCYDDLIAWYPKLKKGGIMSGHDYIDGDYTLAIGHKVRFGVIDAVSDFRREFNIGDDNFHVSGEQYASFFIIK
jgi:hypothetical protein